MPFPAKFLLMFASQKITICPLFGKMNNFRFWLRLWFGLLFLEYSTYIKFQHIRLILMNVGIIWAINLHCIQFLWGVIIFWNPVHIFQCNGGSIFAVLFFPSKLKTKICKQFFMPLHSSFSGNLQTTDPAHTILHPGLVLHIVELFGSNTLTVLWMFCPSSGDWPCVWIWDCTVRTFCCWRHSRRRSKCTWDRSRGGLKGRVCIFFGHCMRLIFA